MVAGLAATCTSALGKCVSDYITATCAISVKIVAFVLTLCCNIAECICIVTIVCKSKGNLFALGYIKFFGIYAFFGIIKGNRCYILALISVCHIPGGVVAPLNTYVADFAEGSNKLAVNKFVDACIRRIILVGIVFAVDISEKIHIISLGIFAAISTYIVYVVMLAQAVVYNISVECACFNLSCVGS